MNISKGVGLGVALGGASVICTPMILGYIGFTAGGVVAGSIAAGIQSSIGVITAGSTFASAQSIGAAGLASSTQLLITGGSAIVGGIIGFFKKEENGEIKTSVIEEIEEKVIEEKFEDKTTKNVGIETDSILTSIQSSINQLKNSSSFENAQRIGTNSFNAAKKLSETSSKVIFTRIRGYFQKEKENEIKKDLEEINSIKETPNERENEKNNREKSNEKVKNESNNIFSLLLLFVLILSISYFNLNYKIVKRI